MRNGELSCAFFVSSVLVLFNLLKRVHGTVKTTIDDLKKSGWREIKKPKIGSIIVWEEIDFGNGDKHGHIGFFVGNKRAISNSFKLRSPSLHHWQFNGKRKIKHIFWHNKLN